MLQFPRAAWPLGGAPDDVHDHGAVVGSGATAPTLRFQNNPRSGLVTRTLEGAGLLPTARADYNVLWQKKFLNAFQMRLLQPGQRVNHFPGMNFLTHKVQSTLVPAFLCTLP